MSVLGVKCAPLPSCNMRVLIAEDERRVADAVARGLRREGMAVDVARDGEDALVQGRAPPTTT